MELFPPGAGTAQIVDTQRNTAIHHQIVVELSGGGGSGADPHAGHLPHHILSDGALPAQGIDTDQSLNNDIVAYERFISPVQYSAVIGTGKADDIFEDQIEQTTAHISGTSQFKEIISDKTCGEKRIFHRRVRYRGCDIHPAAAVHQQTIFDRIV